MQNNYSVICLRHQIRIALTETEANAEAQKDFHLKQFTVVKGQSVSNKDYCSGKVMITYIGNKEGGAPSPIEGGAAKGKEK